MIMQSTPQSPQDSRLRQVLRILWSMIKNNWGFKLLAVVLAVVLWSGLITQDPNLTREKVFTDVKISVSGSDSIKRNGMIVVNDLTEQLNGAQLLVDVPQMKYSTASSSTYNPRIDLSRVTETGVQELEVLTTNSATYGTVSEVSPATIQVEVEEYITRYRIPVNVAAYGELPAGFYATVAQPDPPMVAVSGPKSLVDRIVQAEAVLEQSSLQAQEGTVRIAAPFYLLDASGERVESSLLSVTSESVLLDSIVVELTLYSTKSMTISSLGLVSGAPAEGYEIKFVGCEPDFVLAAGKAEHLALLDTLYANNTVDVTGKTDSFQQVLKVRRPSELVYLSSDSVTVEVEIGPIIQDKVLENQKITTENLDKSLRAALSAKTATVTISGPQLWVKGLRSSHIALTCDLGGLTAGEYDLPITCTIQDDEGQAYSTDISPATLHVVIEEK